MAGGGGEKGEEHGEGEGEGEGEWGGGSWTCGRLEFWGCVRVASAEIRKIILDLPSFHFLFVV